MLADAGANVHIHTIRGAGYLMTLDKSEGDKSHGDKNDGNKAGTARP